MQDCDRLCLTNQTTSLRITRLPGDEDGREAAPGRGENIAQFNTVHLRQIDIDNQTGVSLGNFASKESSGTREGPDDEARSSNQSAQRGQNGGVIFDDQNCSAFQLVRRLISPFSREVRHTSCGTHLLRNQAARLDTETLSRVRQSDFRPISVTCAPMHLDIIILDPRPDRNAIR